MYLSWLQVGFDHHTRYNRDVLKPVVVPHFDNHPLAARPMFLDDKTRPYRVIAYLQSEAVTFLPWPAMSPNLNPIENVWNMPGRHVHAVEPNVQNLRQLEAALHHHHIRRLIAGMTCKVETVIQARGGVTGYCSLKHGNKIDVFQVKWQYYSSLWTVKLNA